MDAKPVFHGSDIEKICSYYNLKKENKMISVHETQRQSHKGTGNQTRAPRKRDTCSLSRLPPNVI